MDNEKVRPLLDALRGIGLTVRELPDEREIEAGITEADGVVIFTSHSYFQVVVTLPDLEALLGRFPDKPVVFVRLNESAPVPRVPTHAAAIHIQERGTAELAEFIRDNLENPVICFAEPVSPSAEHEADSAALDVDMSVDIPDFGMLKDIPEIDVSEDSRSKHAENARECPPCKCTPEFEISYDLSTEGENFSVKASESFKSEAPDGECTPAAAGDASVPAGDEPATVILGVSAPQEVKPGEEFIADFLAYLPELEDAVREIVREQSPRAEMRPGLKKCRWKKGVRVQVKLSAGYFSVDPGEDEFEWDGTYQILSFGVEVPKDAETGPVSLKFDVSVGGIRIARLFAEVAVVAKVKSDARVTVTGKPASTAFASYASEDRQRIADRLAALRIHDGLDVFMDHLSLIPGEDWKERLVREIEARELFLLFWSPEAEKSEWVDWEWRTAFALKEQRELPEFEIHPLENGLTPPKELSHLHFGDVFMTIRAAAEQGEGG
jgi:hypothetical protein